LGFFLSQVLDGIPEVTSYQSICLRSFAKINLGLHILGKRKDGYHEIRTLFQSIDLHDRIEITLKKNDGVTLECSRPDLSHSDNLVMKAAQMFVNVLDRPVGLHLRLEKTIPIGAGLGGGSSNAATTLLGLQRLLGRRLSTDQLFELGGHLGADVPYFFVGGTALGVGRGSEVYPLEEHDENHVLVIVPPFSVPTPNAYARTGLGLTRRVNDSMIPVFCSGYLDSIKEWRLLENDFEKTVLEDQAELRQIIQDLTCLGARGARLTGSGAALFALFGSEDELQKAQDRFSSANVRVIRTRTLSRVQYWQCLVESLQ
jgi:4-diphosphocytidyl-2-C-methyl-D-erythritol kinase